MQIAKRGHRVNLWGRDKALIEKIRDSRCNEVYLPGVPLPGQIRLHHDLGGACAGSEFILCAVPTTAIREVSACVAAETDLQNRPLAWACKGIERTSGSLVHQIIEQTCNGKVATAAIGGPSFAAEVAAGKPTAVVIASAGDSAAKFARLLHGENLRVYTTGDIIGVETGGALKNVIAIAAGICRGLEFGDNAKAALIARGLNEMINFAVAAGGSAATMMGLAGLGDLVLSCTSEQSRNHQYGVWLGRGLPSEQALKKIHGVIEGHWTTPIVLQLAEKYAIEMPICKQVERVINGQLGPREAVQELLKRPGKAEKLMP